jgi:hypothetical protein
MNWRSSLHAPGEGTRPSAPWLGLNERGFSSLVGGKNAKQEQEASPETFACPVLPETHFHAETPSEPHRCSLSSPACLSGDCLLLRRSVGATTAMRLVPALAGQEPNGVKGLLVPSALSASRRETTSCLLCSFA